MNKKWKVTEKIVQLIEQSINPDSRIEHDIRLQDRNSTSGLKRQCDLIIRTGVYPRETITIVEIQDRNKKVEQYQFDSWVQKMRDVGAQHLICVSKKGFPTSVVEKAQRLGPTVRLVNYSQIEDGYWPLSFFKDFVTTRRREIIAIEEARIDFASEKKIDREIIDLALSSKSFVIDNDEYSTSEIIMMYLDYYETNISKLRHGVNKVLLLLPISNNPDIFCNVNGEKYKLLSMKLHVSINYSEIKNELTSFKYEQIDYNSELAWIFHADVNINRKDSKLSVIFIPQKDGSYRIVNELKSYEDYIR